MFKEIWGVNADNIKKPEGYRHIYRLQREIALKALQKGQIVNKELVKLWK